MDFTHLGVNTVPCFNQFHEYLNQKCIISESLVLEDYTQQKENTKSSLHVYTSRNSSSLSPFTKCSFCSDFSHKIYSCLKFKKLVDSEKF